MKKKRFRLEVPVDGLAIVRKADFEIPMKVDKN
jgi:hypothetical protein